MWTKHNPPPKSKYNNYQPHVKVQSNTDTPRARIHEQIPGQTGATVLYRDHVKGFLHYDKRLQRSIDVALPKPLYAFLERYEGIPDDKVPPVIGAMRTKRRLETTDWKRQVQIRQYCFVALPGKSHKIYCFLEGQTAFFVEEDLIRMRGRRSYDFKTDQARLIAASEQKLLKLRWKETFEIPDQAAVTS